LLTLCHVVRARSPDLKTSSLAVFAHKYLQQDPRGGAHVLETMSEEEALEVLRAVSPTLAAETLTRMSDVSTSVLLQKLSPTLFQAILEKLEPGRAASLFMNLPADTRKLFLDHLTEKQRNLIREYLSYPEDSAGRIMTSEFMAFNKDLHVRDVVEKLRKLDRKKVPASYAYVVDDSNVLVGILNMRDMIVAARETPLRSIMRTGVFAVHCFMDKEKISQELAARKLFAVPVTDEQKHLLGVIKAEQLLGDVQDAATEDLQKMFGAGGDERTFSTMNFSLRKRLPWLHVNLATAFLAAAVVALFEDIIAKITILAVFLPVVAGQGGNAGAQSLAVVMRGLVMREIPKDAAKKLILKETWIGCINGVIIGLVTGLVAWLWHGNAFLGIVIGLGMIVNLSAAGFAGAAIPITMKAVGLDPAQCSNIILTTVTDVMGFFAFLGFAVLFQSYLV
jgi:magnesium transporter